MYSIPKLRDLWKASTRVVGWYPHGTGDGYHLGKASVRGPFGRWFIVDGGDNGMGDPVKYPTPVASLEDDANYAAAAMNSLPALLDLIDEARETFALMADGEGDDHRVYMEMAKNAFHKLDRHYK